MAPLQPAHDVAASPAWAWLKLAPADGDVLAVDALGTGCDGAHVDVLAVGAHAPRQTVGGAEGCACCAVAAGATASRGCFGRDGCGGRRWLGFGCGGGLGCRGLRCGGGFVGLGRAVILAIVLRAIVLTVVRAIVVLGWAVVFRRAGIGRGRCVGRSAGRGLRGCGLVVGAAAGCGRRCSAATARAAARANVDLLIRRDGRAAVLKTRRWVGKVNVDALLGRAAVADVGLKHLAQADRSGTAACYVDRDAVLVHLAVADAVEPCPGQKNVVGGGEIGRDLIVV